VPAIGGAVCRQLHGASALRVFAPLRLNFLLQLLVPAEFIRRQDAVVVSVEREKQAANCAAFFAEPEQTQRLNARSGLAAAAQAAAPFAAAAAKARPRRASASCRAQ
jgi:hypothetical protein